MNHVACCFGMGGLASLLSSSLSSSFPSLSNGQKHALAMGSGYEVVTQAALHAAPSFSLSLFVRRCHRVRPGQRLYHTRLPHVTTSISKIDLTTIFLIPYFGKKKNLVSCDVNWRV